MAKKNSFVMHNEWGDAIDLMTYEQKGKMLEALLNYSRGLEVSIDDPALTLVFAMFKQRIDADSEKYQKTCETRAAAGTKGGEAKGSKPKQTEAKEANASKSKQKLAKEANASKSKQTEANEADIDIDTDIDIDPDIDFGFELDNGFEKEKEPIKTIVEYLNAVVGVHFKPDTPKTVALIRARLREGFTVDDFKTVIDKKAAHWARDGDMQRYLRPETLFGTKFEGYLNEHEKLSTREEVDSWV